MNQPLQAFSLYTRAWFLVLACCVVSVSGQDGVVAEVDGHPFDQAELEHRLFARLGRQFTQYCIDLYLYEREAERRGLRVEDGELEVFVELRAAEAEQAAGGKQAYLELLAAQGSSPEAEKQRLREDGRPLLLAQKLVRTERVRDEALRIAFELRYGAMLHARHILVRFEVPEDEDSVYVAMQCEERLRRLAEKLENGASFAKLAEEYSEDPVTRAVGGDLGPLLIAELDASVAAAIQEVPEGRWSEPVQSGQGFHIVYVEKRQDATQRFEDVVADIRRELLLPEVGEEEMESLTRRLRAQADIRWN